STAHTSQREFLVAAGSWCTPRILIWASYEHGEITPAAQRPASAAARSAIRCMLLLGDHCLLMTTANRGIPRSAARLARDNGCPSASSRLRQDSPRVRRAGLADVRPKSGESARRRAQVSQCPDLRERSTLAREQTEPIRLAHPR